jgi:hypothetical protein
MAFACAQGGIRCSRQLSWLNSKVSVDEGCLLFGQPHLAHAAFAEQMQKL